MCLFYAFSVKKPAKLGMELYEGCLTLQNHVSELRDWLPRLRFVSPSSQIE
jgi:hypothetical protein